MEKINTDNKIISFNEIEKKLAKLKKKNKLIVHCHGVFDLLHPGHLMHFKSAKKFGDILIVSVTSDKFVNKGFNRPYFDINTRIKMISEMSIVDFVCPFNAYREMPLWDMTIWVNTICESPYEDTNKAFEEPKKEPTYTIFNWEEVDDIIEEVAYKLLNQEEE